MSDKLVIKQLNPNRLSDVQFLAKACINTKFSIEFLKKKYATHSYSGVAYCCCLGYYDDQPVAFYGAIPLIFSKKGGKESFLLFQSCDTYTLPKYQGKGIHKKLALASYELMKEAGAKGVFAFLNESSFNSCKKLDWKLLRRFQVIEINNLSRFPTLKLMDKLSFLRPLSSKIIQKKLRAFEWSDVLENDFSKHYLGVEFSEKYIHYKNGSRVLILKIDDCKVWLKIDSVIYIGAIENLNPENALKTMSKLELLAGKLGTDKLIFEIEKDHPAFHLLNNKYHGKEAFKLGGLLFDNTFNFEDLRLNFSEFDNFLSV